MKNLTPRQLDQIENLISQMTIEEKAGQLNLPPLFEDDKAAIKTASEGQVGGIVLAYTQLAGSEARIAYHERLKNLQEAAARSRLGIPILFGRDVIHGHRTVFPVPLGQAAAFDAKLVEESSAIAAREALNDGIKWVYAPMADIARDARWGRIVEGYGEDPLLASVLTRASVRGFQANGIAACVKHYVGYGAVEGGRDYGTAEISELALRNIYLPPFKAAVDEGVLSVMTAFHDLGGEPLTMSYRLITELLKNELSFKGMVVSDWDAVGQLIRQGPAADRKQAALLSINAGIDMDMTSGCYIDYLPSLVSGGLVSNERLDDAVRRVLSVKAAVGLLDNLKQTVKTPLVQTTSISPTTRDEDFSNTTGNDNIKQDFLDTATKLATASCVLLKNNDNILPLPKCAISVLLIGPYADEGRNHLGCWTLDGRAEDSVTLKQGLLQVNPDINLNILLPGDEVNAASEADYVIAAIGESWDDSGEARSNANITIPVTHHDLLKSVYEVNKNIIVILSCGRPLVIEEMLSYSAATLLSWQGGTMAGLAIAKLIFGDENPSGKLPVTFPRFVAQNPIYYNYRVSSRSVDEYYEKSDYPAYQDATGKPLFPFGYGLSYTEFKYGEVNITIDGKQTQINIVIKNTGSYDGYETVQCYASLRGGNFVRPIRELIRWEKVYLKAGEKKEVIFNYDIPADVHTADFYVGSDCQTTNCFKVITS